MNKLLRRIVLCILLIAFCNLNHSQNQKEKQKLAQILTQLEKRFEVKFSFETKTIEDIIIESPSYELSLKQTLNYLNKKTSLSFNILSERFIAILPKNDFSEYGAIQQLDEILVSNYLARGISKTNNGTVEVKTKAFEILPGLIEPDVLQIVQSLPGIVSVDERISNLNVRGGTNDQNLILFEGIRMYQSGHFFGLISAFNPYLSEEIIVSKNGTSAKFGNGVSSTILINNSDEIEKSLSAGIGANLLNVDGFAKIPISEKAALQLSARRSFTDVWVSETYDSYFDRIFRDSELNSSTESNTLLSLDERFLFYDFNAKFLYELNSTSKININVLNIYNKLDYNQIFATANNGINETQSNLNQISYGASIEYLKNWKRNLSTSVQAYFSKYDLKAENNDVTNNQNLVQENEVTDLGLRLDVSKSIDSLTKFNAGYQFNEVSVSDLEDVNNPNFTSFKKEIIRTHALFGEIQWKSDSRNTYIRFGARINYFEKLAEILMEPRLAFNQKLSDHFRLEVLAELKSQSITQVVDLQQDFFGIEKRRWQLANNDNVPLTKSQQASVGLSYKFKDFLVSAQGYYKNVSDIASRSQGFQNQFQFTNDIGSYTVTGFDLLFNKQFNSFSTWLSYTYSKNNYNFENLNGGNTFPNSLDLRHVANASLTYNLNNLKIGIGVNWHSGRPFTSPSGTQNENNSTIEFKSPNSSRVDDYFRTDISAIYNFNLNKKVKAEVAASFWNVFNQTNIINRFYTEDTENNITEVDNRSLKFTPNLSFKVRF